MGGLMMRDKEYEKYVVSLSILLREFHSKGIPLRKWRCIPMVNQLRYTPTSNLPDQKYWYRYGIDGAICAIREILRSCEPDNTEAMTALNLFDTHLAVAQANYDMQSTKTDYKSYIQSDAWKQRALKAKEKAGWKCQLCNKDGDKASLHTHHRTYERLGNEEPDDLIVLCADCHAKFHDKDK